MSWEDLKASFKRYIGEKYPQFLVQDYNSSVMIKLNDYMKFDLRQEGDLGVLDYWIEHENWHPMETQNLINRFNVREYNNYTYYRDRHWQLRNRIVDANNLYSDLDKLLKTISLPHENYNSDGCVNKPPIYICNEVSAYELLLTGEWNLRIPPYQRPYCWREKNVKSFVKDLLFWNKNHDNGVCHHLGTIVLKEQNDQGGSIFDIIDGQQRLTTLAILAFLQNKSPLLNTQKKYTESEKQTVLRAKNAIGNYVKELSELDFVNIVFSVVVLSEPQPDDLAYTFFSNNNSTGKKLSDYDLLKTHHLRYVVGDVPAEKLSKNWVAFERTGQMDDVLQKMLFRLRNWNQKLEFPIEANEQDGRDIFNHYKSLDSSPDFPSFAPQSFRFNTLLVGGNDFFTYAEYYRKRYDLFLNFDAVKLLDHYLSWHSGGVIYSGIKAISFLFFCKFGDMYINEAVYLLAYRLSELRNQTRVMRKNLCNNIFYETTQILDLVHFESQFFEALNSSENQYKRSNEDINHQTALRYWKCLDLLMEAIRKSSPSVEKFKLI